MEETICEPGNFLLYDCRKKDHGKDVAPNMLKCVQWNVERGYRLHEVIVILKRHQADIICLQELAIGCERSNVQNVPKLIADALEMNCVFVTEFVELHSSRRSRRTQGGGVHGNAILSRFDMEPFVIPHSHHPVNWEKDGTKIYEPRYGERVGLGANILVPGSRPIRCYCLHLEVFCGIFSRLKQFIDILEDSKKHLDDYPIQMIFGDLNTMAHGIARFSPLYCSDKLRLLSIGYSEAQWWQRYIFDHTVDEEGLVLSKHVPRNLSSKDINGLQNPHFYDPFCMTKDTTLHNYFGMFKGKLDWTLLRGMHVLAKGMDNHDFTASDHKLLYVVVRPCQGRTGEELDEDVRKAYHEGRVLINHTRNFYKSIAMTAVLTSSIVYCLLRLKDLS